MIISASRRTDIPAFYSRWFIRRVRAGYCTVPNPFNPRQVARVSLAPEDVDAFVFWTRNPRPLFRYLDELEDMGFAYYVLYTLMDNPRELDPHSPGVEKSLRTFRQLAGRIGPGRVVWRYDPIVYGGGMDRHFHRRRFGRIAEKLGGRTHRVVVSFVDVYRKIVKRLQAAAGPGGAYGPPAAGDAARLAAELAAIASRCGMQISSCAESFDLASRGIEAGKCIDDGLISRIAGRNLRLKKDPAQRKACRCAVSRDIGMYDTCLYGCRYCYATSSVERTRRNRRRHDLDAPSLIRGG